MKNFPLVWPFRFSLDVLVAAMGFVYFIRCDDQPGIYKIGKTDDLKQRLACFQTSRSATIRVVHHIFSHSTFRLERDLHRFLKDRHVRGEWFRLTDEEASEVHRAFEERDTREEPDPPHITEGCALVGSVWLTDDRFRCTRQTFEEWARQHSCSFPVSLRTRRLACLFEEYDRRQIIFELASSFDKLDSYKFRPSKVTSKYFARVDPY